MYHNGTFNVESVKVVKDKAIIMSNNGHKITHGTL